MAKKPRQQANGKPPKFILNGDLADDCDDDPPVMGAPDEDGWIYLNRSRKPKEGQQRAKKGRRKA